MAIQFKGRLHSEHIMQQCCQKFNEKLSEVKSTDAVMIFKTDTVNVISLKPKFNRTDNSALANNQFLP